jgi:L,D-transpeptidase catalytic domain
MPRRPLHSLSIWFWMRLALVTPLACDPSDDAALAPDAEPVPEAIESGGAGALAPRDDGPTTTDGPTTGDAVDPAADTPGRAAPVRLGSVDHRGAEHVLARVAMLRAGEPEPPIEIRRADRAAMIYAQPRFGAEFRGKLPHGQHFGVYERGTVDLECRGAGWARVGRSAFACLEHTTVVKHRPVELPRLAKGQLTPYFYARISRKSRKGEAPPPGRWSSRTALAAGEPPIDVLVTDHDYAFERRRPSRHGTLLVDKSSRVVREAEVRRLEPSAFAGRDVVAEPLPDDRRLAWSIAWPYASIRASAAIDAKLVARAAMQTVLFVADEVVTRRGTTWVAVAGEPAGWVDAEEIRRWFPAAPPDGLADDELWIDVELEQQTLAVLLGDTPLFVTMIASGNHKHPTPQGVFRIQTKMATSDMDSQPGEEEPYAVEGVPWAQFFHKRYGLHGTFWHNRFGRRTSHGCVNLSAKDAALLYAITTPDPLPGWAMAFAHANEQGTVVRVRKLDNPVVDRR